MNDFTFTQEGFQDYLYWQRQDKKTLKKIWNVIEKGSIFAALSQNGEATGPPLEREVH